MDLQCLNVNNCNPGPVRAKLCYFLQGNSCPRRSFSCNFTRLTSFRSENRSFFEIKGLKSKHFSSLVVTAMGEKNLDNSSSSGSSDQSIPEEDGSTGNNPASYDKEFDVSDWRNFRAKFVGQEQERLVDIDVPFHDGVSHLASKPLSPKWAHPISVPETGCVLVATEKLDGVSTFERSVVLLLKSGTKGPGTFISFKTGLPIPKIWEDSIGIIISRPLHLKMKHMNPANLDLTTTFADCSLYFGGPLQDSMFLSNTEDNSQLPVFEQVISGVCFGSKSCFDEAADLVEKGILRPQDFRFFIGCIRWTPDQLKKEIESDDWYVAACSANVMCGDSSGSSSSEGLWEEILQLMGGQYAELSRKPKKDS